MMTRLLHPNIVNFFGAVWDPPAFWLVLEYANGGSLRSALCHPVDGGASDAPAAKKTSADLD